MTLHMFHSSGSHASGAARGDRHSIAGLKGLVGGNGKYIRQPPTERERMGGWGWCGGGVGVTWMGKVESGVRLQPACEEG